MNQEYLFFDNASTTRCCDEAADLVRRFASDDYGNPSSAHHYGQAAARAIREARVFFAEAFGVKADQVIFTGSGSESDNLAILGVAQDVWIKRDPSAPPPRVVTSSVEHPAVAKTVQSLADFGMETRFTPVDSKAQLREDLFHEDLSPNTVLVSIQRLNNIVGAVLPVEELANSVKARLPGVIFHTDAVQAFGKVSIPKSASAVDLVSISAHKIEGPKGVGALIILNRKLLQSGLRPLIWGGSQEGGFRSGTQNAGLIAGFHAAAKKALQEREHHQTHAALLCDRLKKKLHETALLERNLVLWNSPENAAPHIISLSVPRFPSGPLAKLLEERGCLVSTGSACSSQKVEEDPVLHAMGLPRAAALSALRISFSSQNTESDVDHLVKSLSESIERMSALLGPSTVRR